ncbi:hypothetical protein H8356DRAFT_1350337 [Neocallimastix lanati (nom. inval.)]|nr:hypothetical protein H8356DRAFT_1350337 [Neocallimastix sp. JGI-2020a]
MRALVVLKTNSTRKIFNLKCDWDNHIFTITRNRALLWWTNSFYNFSIICPVCLRKFNRAHLNNCIFGLNTPFIQNRHRSYYHENLSIYTLPYSYIILDFLLNHHEYSAFHQAIDYLDSFRKRLHSPSLTSISNSKKKGKTPS